MCGICGVMVFEPGVIDGLGAAVAAMSATLLHRGPDGAGLWSSDDGRLAFGHRRLSIIDIQGGAQPMIRPSGCVVVLNGEIYNYPEIRRELIEQGTTFRTDSDTEVLLAAYERWGTACLDRLNGMFAFALWDPRNKTVFLARDRLGKKPLYYYRDDAVFAFASEPKALLALPRVARAVTVDPTAISDFLSLGYILGPKSVFSEIKRLPPGHHAVLDQSDMRLNIGRYWSLAAAFQDDKRPWTPATQDELRDLLKDAVRLRLRADVPLGAYLSGGLDSSTICALMKDLSVSAPQAYCLGFDDPRFDETPHARRVAAHLGISLVERRPGPVSPRTLSRIVWNCDEPFADTSMMPSDQLAEAVRSAVPVALSGDGGDEIFAGYATYRADAAYRVYARLPGIVQDLAAALAARIRPRYGKVGWDYKARQFLNARRLSPERAHYWWRVVYSEQEKAALMHPDMIAACAGYDPFETFAARFAEVPSATFLDRVLYVDTMTWLPDDILVKADRTSMAHGLELRAPFLDYRVVEFAARLPPAAKMSGQAQKIALKAVMRDRLPEEILARTKKGFNAPTRSFMSVAPGKSAELGLTNAAFRLDPEREDVTFKAFSLKVLDTWATMLDAFRISGQWEPPS